MDRSGDLELLRGACRGGAPPFPSPAVRLAIDLAADEDSNDEALIAQLDADPWLTFAMLAGANLPIVGPVRSISTMRQVVAHLGRRKCLTLLWLTALSDCLRTWPHANDRARLKLWRHSLLTGILAHELCAATGMPGTGDPLAAGVAHDIGHLLLHGPGARLGIVWHEEHERLVEPGHWAAPERNHCRLGASLLALWKAPVELIACAMYHHDPSSADLPHVPLIVGVRLADLLAEHLELERPARPLHLEASPVWQQLAATEPWKHVAQLHILAIERLPPALLAAEHLGNLLGT